MAKTKSTDEPQAQLTVEVRSTTDGRGMVLLVMAGLMKPDHAIELSKMLLDEAVKATEDASAKKGE